MLEPIKLVGSIDLFHVIMTLLYLEHRTSKELGCCMRLEKLGFESGR